MDVVIVGGGVGGLAAAVALRQAGAEVTVLERAATLEPLGAGISLFPNAVLALRSLGLAGSLTGPEFPPGGGGLWRWDGTPLATEDPAEIERRYGAPIVPLHRAQLQAALLGGLAGGDVVRSSAAVERIEQDADGARVVLAGGEVVGAGLVVGADGIRSTVRASLLGAEEPAYSGIVAYRSVVDFPNPERIGEFWGPGGVFGIVPLSGSRVYWFATQLEEDPAASPPDLQAAFADWCAPIPAVLRAGGEVLRHPLADRPPTSTWTQGRVTLLGDAAHPMLPFLGQGACQAIEDAVALGEAVRADGLVPAALTRYEAARRKRAAMIVKRSRGLGRIAHLRAGWQRTVRDAVVRSTPAFARRRQMDAVIRT